MKKLFRCCYLTSHHKKKHYKYDEWNVTDDIHIGMSFADRIYVDMSGELITGILEGFYGYTTNTSDEKNCQYVKNGKVKEEMSKIESIISVLY